MHGEGVYIYPDRTKYDGPFIEGFKEGMVNSSGLMEDAISEIFKKTRDMAGGVYFPDGRKFIGEFVNGSMRARSFEFPDGRIYSGNFLNGLPHHSGVLKFSDGRYYKGEFEQGQSTARAMGLCRRSTLSR